MLAITKDSIEVEVVGYFSYIGFKQAPKSSQMRYVNRVVSLFPSLYRFIPNEFKTREISMMAIKGDASTILDIDEPSMEMIYEAIEKKPSLVLSINNVPHSAIKRALSINGKLIESLPKHLTRIKSIVIRAVPTHISAARYLNRISDDAYKLGVVKQHNDSLQYLQFDSKEMHIEAISVVSKNLCLA